MLENLPNLNPFLLENQPNFNRPMGYKGNAFMKLAGIQIFNFTTAAVKLVKPTYNKSVVLKKVQQP